MVLVSRIEKSWSTFKVAFFILSLLVIPLLGQAAGPSTLVDIPQVNSANGINGYIEALYTLAITAASLIAIIQLIKAGSKYVFSAVVTDKGEAKKDIRNALIGLLIIIGAVTILNEINPQLTNLNILGNATQLTNPEGSNVPDLSIPDYLKPSSNQNLSLIKCSGQKNDVGELDCSAAIQKCLNQNGTTRNNKVMSGNLLCYTNVQTCNGYYDQQTKTCYDNTVGLGEEFSQEGENIRQQECLRVTQSQGEYINGVCYRRANTGQGL